MGEGNGNLVGELERERRRNLEHKLRGVEDFAKLAAAGEPDDWRSYVEVINAFYRDIGKRLEDPHF